MRFEFTDQNIEHTDGIKTHSSDIQTFVESLGVKNDKIVFTSEKLIKEEGLDKIIVCLHSKNTYMFENTTIDWRPNTVFVTHYRDTQKKLQELGLDAVFISMGIDLDRLPKKKKGNGKWIYYGNLYEDKIDTYNILKEYIDFDTVSYNELNKDGIKRTHEECLEIVSNYSYGIGVGKCAMEMASMGLPVLIAGRDFGGTLCTEEDYNFHVESNFNSDISNSKGLEQDIIKMRKGNSINSTLFSHDKNEWKNLLI